MKKSEALELIARKTSYSPGFNEALQSFMLTAKIKNYIEGNSNKHIADIAPGRKYALEVRVSC